MSTKNGAGKGDKTRAGANFNAYWNNFDNIFRREKKTVYQWQEKFGDIIKSYDGFRHISESDLITEEEYKKGLTSCTIMFKVKS